MSQWDGKERRSNMFNQEFYDRMMEMANNMNHLVEWSKEHTKEDDDRHKDTGRKLFWLAILILIVAAAAGVLPQVLGHVKVGG